MANRREPNTRPSLARRIPGFTCGHTRGGIVACLHERSAHKFDEIDGSSWCDECWADDDPAIHAIAYHAFEEGVYARV
jgi:hypothetical protein